MATALERITLERQMIEKAASYLENHIGSIQVESTTQDVFDKACRILKKEAPTPPEHVKTPGGRRLWEQFAIEPTQDEFKILIQALRQSTNPDTVAVAYQKLKDLV